MKRSPWVYLLPILAFFVLLGVFLYFLNPLGPLFLLASLLVQVPLIWGIARASVGSSYRERAAARQQQYEKDGDAEAWLAGEEKEAASIGFKYWSKAGRSLSALNRARALWLLGRRDEAAQLAAQVEEKKLSGPEQAQYADLQRGLQEDKIE